MQQVRGQDRVDTKVAEIVPQLAPSANQADVNLLGDLKRPDRFLCVATFFIAMAMAIMRFSRIALRCCEGSVPVTAGGFTSREIDTIAVAVRHRSAP